MKFSKKLPSTSSNLKNIMQTQIPPKNTKHSLSDGLELWLSDRPAMKEKWDRLSDVAKENLVSLPNKKIWAWFHDMKPHYNLNQTDAEKKHAFRTREGIPCDCPMCD